MKFRILQSITRTFPIVFILIVSCAKIEPPPGGPIDKTGPSIISSQPAGGAIGVPRDNKISIGFSENVDRHSAVEAIYISPRFKGEIDYRWKGKTLNIDLPDSFAAGVTYVVGVGADLTDMRNNKMGKSHAFAFSTGTIIEQGTISGDVYQNNKPMPNISVGIFDSIGRVQNPYLDSLYPAYLTQSGEKGQYSLEFLPDGDYFVLAFNDKDKNQLFDYPDEEFGVADRLARVVSGKAPTLNFSLHKEDTVSVSIISAGPTVDHLIKVRFSRPVKGGEIVTNLEKITLAPADSASSILYPRSVLEGEEDTVAIFNIFFGDLPEGSYRLKIDKLIFPNTHHSGGQSGKGDSSAFLESTAFKIKSEPDKNVPSIISVSHSGKTIFPDEKQIRILFSEPIDRKAAGDSLVMLEVKGGDTLRTTSKWLDDFKLSVTPDSLEWGKTYNILLRQNFLVDLAGNKAGDSVKIFSFNTYNKDSLGSISGSISYSGDVDSSGLLYLQFHLIEQAKKFVLPTPGKSFSYQLPPGKYLLSGYIDRNDNGRQDPGKLDPFEFSETSANYPDTIKVRARFETAGVEFIIK